MSGANGYVEDFTKWSKNSSLDDVEITYDSIKVNKLTRSTVLYVTSNKFINKIKIVASGIPNGGKLTFTQYPDNAIENNKEFEIGGVTTTGSWGFSIKEGLNLDWSNLVIQQIGEHEGSICFDGTDDYIIIPTIKHGGRALLMKMNWRYKNNIAMAYDQRINWRGFGISISQDQLPDVAYKPYHKVTYIDGIKNESVLVQDLEGITHNITGIYDNLNLSDERDVCISRTSDVSNSGFADMSMYEFMLFPDVPSEDEIKELNDIIGIEGGYVESPDYYWDAYGKKNTDTDRNLIADQISKDVANALEVKNVAYNSESGYTDDNGLLLDGVEDHAINTVIPAVTDFTVIAKRTDLRVANPTTFFIQKGLLKGWNGGGAFSDGHYEGSAYYCSSFGRTNDITSVYNKEFFYQTPTNYNGVPINIGDKVDSNGLIIGAGIFSAGGGIVGYYEGVFYKMMLYPKTIDQLSINMLKNLFERDELIDITNPIFKKKEL